MERLRIETLIPLTGDVSLILFYDHLLDCHDAELVLNTPAIRAFYRNPSDPGIHEKCKEAIKTVIKGSQFNIPENAVEVTIPIEEALYNETQRWCEKNEVEMEKLVHALLRFVTGQVDKAQVVKFTIELKEKQGLAPLYLKNCYSVTRAEFERDFDLILEKCESGVSPIRITEEGKPDLLLFEWEDYWRRFGALHSPSERQEIEAEALRLYRAEQDTKAEDL